MRPKGCKATHPPPLYRYRTCLLLFFTNRSTMIVIFRSVTQVKLISKGIKKTDKNTTKKIEEMLL